MGVTLGYNMNYVTYFLVFIFWCVVGIVFLRHTKNFRHVIFMLSHNSQVAAIWFLIASILLWPLMLVLDSIKR